VSGSDRQGLGQLQAGVVLGEKAHGPLPAECHQQAALEVLQQGGAGAQHQILRLAGAGGDDPQVLVGQSLHVELYAVLAPHPVLEHVELQGAHDAHDDLLQAGAGQLENL
ncbi:Restriction endonuclease subunit S, partial [Dysosmobacter welbionis]